MPPQVTNRDLDEKLEKLEECAAENYRALRGSNGEVGLVGRVASLEEKVDKIISNDLPHLKEEILKELTNFRALYEKDQQSATEKNVQWPRLAEKFLFPIILAVMTAVVVALIMKGTGLSP